MKDDFSEWIEVAAKVLKTSWGLDKSFSLLVARLYLYFYFYGLDPKITSGFRNPAKQQQLLERWERGDPSIVAKPATNSKHSITKYGRPAALAVDISTNDHHKAAQVAKMLNVKAGYFFNSPDPVHFYT